MTGDTLLILTATMVTGLATWLYYDSAAHPEREAMREVFKGSVLVVGVILALIGVIAVLFMGAAYGGIR